MSTAASCTHLYVSWRTDLQPDGMTCGWWECDSGCGVRFFPTRGNAETLLCEPPAAAECDPLRARLAASEKRAETAQAALRSFALSVGKANAVYIDEIRQAHDECARWKQSHDGQQQNTIAFMADADSLRAMVAELCVSLEVLCDQFVPYGSPIISRARAALAAAKAVTP